MKTEIQSFIFRSLPAAGLVPVGLFLLCFGLMAPVAADAATIWNGPLITFTQASPYPDPPGDRDQLTPNVALTRAVPDVGNGGLFNAVTESFFTKDYSPADTEWAVGSLADYASLTYSDWTTAGGGSPVHNYPGEQLVVHLISDDIYLSLQFISLPDGPGFSYVRSTPAPVVTITNPVSGAVFAAPANVTIQASASDSAGTVTNVQFLIGSTVLTNKAAAPFAATARNLAAGSYTLSAIASDNGGATATNSVSVSVVTPVPLQIASPARPSKTNFQFSYTANAGLSYFVQRSTNLTLPHWSTLATNLAGSNLVNFTDLSATNNRAFYRVGRLPNP